MSETFAARTLRGVRWTLVSQVIRVVIRAATLVTLSRLVAPRDFGVMGMAAAVSGLVEIFSDLGTSAALIQKREPSRRLLSTLFWTNVAFGFVFAVGLLFVAPWIAAFYGNARVTGVLQLLSLAFVVTGVRVVQETYFARALDFHILAKVEVGAAVVASGAGIASASVGWGAYSLALYALTASIVTTSLIWSFSPWRPEFTFSFGDLRSVGSFSANVVGFNLVNYAARNADYVLIGRFLGATKLGFYSLAYNFLLLPVQLLSWTIGRVAFPAYSEIQTDIARLGRVYLRMAKATSFLAFPLMMSLVVIADPLVRAVYGERWGPAVRVVEILAPVGVFQSLAALNGSVYRAVGRADLQMRVGLVFSYCLYVGALQSGSWGIVGVAACYAFVHRRHRLSSVRHPSSTSGRFRLATLHEQ